MSKMFKCLGCKAIISISSTVQGRLTPNMLVDSNGKPVGCATCGSTKYAPIMKQLPPEDSEGGL